MDWGAGAHARTNTEENSNGDTGRTHDQPGLYIRVAQAGRHWGWAVLYGMVHPSRVTLLFVRLVIHRDLYRREYPERIVPFARCRPASDLDAANE